MISDRCAATNLSMWRYLNHTEPWTLFPVTSEYDSARYISALRPDADCQDRCMYGYCTTYPSIVRSNSPYEFVHRDGVEDFDKTVSASGEPQCDCYPDASVKDKSEDTCRASSHLQQFKCPDSCSFAGNCTRGFCSCFPGFWGSGADAQDSCPET